MEPETPLSTAELGSLKYAACTEVCRFVTEVVHPLVDQHTQNIPMFFHMACDAITARIRMWLTSFRKLDHPGDFQAVLAGTRAMFEIAVDLTLFNLQEGKSLAKLMHWQRSAKLAWAERLVRHNSASRQWAAKFIQNEGEEIKTLRSQTWPKRQGHPSRWTGNSLEVDARIAERLRPNGFVEYYNVEYNPTCWQVHGKHPADGTCAS